MSLYILYDIGDGLRVKFWQDQWCGEIPLAVNYPKLFRICRDKEASVAELMKFTNGVFYWDLSFFRGVPDWELEAVTSFMDTINSSFVRGFREDKMSWTQDRNKGFLVNDFYNLLVAPMIFVFFGKEFISRRSLLGWLSLSGLLLWGNV